MRVQMTVDLTEEEIVRISKEEFSDKFLHVELVDFHLSILFEKGILSKKLKEEYREQVTNYIRKKS